MQFTFNLHEILSKELHKRWCECNEQLFKEN
jgi:hypothetical protein